MPAVHAVLVWAAITAAPEAADMPEPRAHVTVEGVTRPVRHATFGLHLQTEVWDREARVSRYGPEHAEMLYDLRVEVDEHSGEDGALLPHVQTMPVRRAAGGRHPSLAELATLTVREDDHDCEEWDAWFGNDAPGLCGNLVTFQGWEGGALRVRWEAHYDEGPRQLPFRFEGLADFTGIHVSVRDAHEADLFLARAWGGQPVETLERHVLGWSDYGETFAANRRFWYSVVYTAKGAPLPERYRVAAPTKEAATAAHEADQARYKAAFEARQREIVAAATAGGAAPTPPASGPSRRMSDGGGRFSLELPAEWRAVPTGEDPIMAQLGGLSLRRGSGTEAETLKAVAVEMQGAGDLGAYVDASAKAYANIWQVEERGAASLAGVQGQRLVILQKIGPVTTRLLKYFVAAGGRQAIVMTFAAPPGVFGARRAGYEEAARSLVLERPR